MKDTLPPDVARLAAQAWAFRHRVEREASVRFVRIAERLRLLGMPASICELATRAASDELAHAEHCRALATVFGAVVDASAPVEVPEIAPPGLDPRGRTLYEVVAACCITETESAGVLTTLLAEAPLPQVKEVLHALARDEVQHARLGWAALTFARTQGDVTFLAPLIPMMLAGTAPAGLFRAAADPVLESPELLRAGVLPHTLKRETFVQMLREVVFPGLSELGVSPAPAQAWLAAQSS